MFGRLEDWRRDATKYDKCPKSSSWLSRGVAMRFRSGPALRPAGYCCSAKGNLEPRQIYAIGSPNLANQAKIIR